MANVNVSEITIKLSHDEAYALCNKLYDMALIEPTNHGFCEYDQLILLQKLGKQIGFIIGHTSEENDLSINFKAERKKYIKENEESYND